MKLRIIGSSGSELPGHNLPAFLLDDFLLLDAGTIGRALNRKAQGKISHILVTHAHLDHIKEIAFLADNLAINNIKKHITVISGRDVLADIKRNIFNNRIWPDFTVIPDKENPVIKYQEISQTNCLQIKNYNIYAAKMNHSVACYGYIIEQASSGKTLVYTGDTGPTEKLWKRLSRHDVRALIIEASFPDSMSRVAVQSGHLTPLLLEGELRKLAKVPEKVYITHIKPQYRKDIERGLKKLKRPSIELLKDNTVISV